MMPDCKKMIHPFQTDPGTSQRQRMLEDLLSGPAKIDARTLADLLDFFVQLSRHVNYYDEQMVISDWQPFFKKSLPFTIAAIMKYDRGATEKKLAGYKKRFERKPSAAGLQLLLSYTYNNIIKKINSWQQQMVESGLPIQTAMEQLIKDKLSSPAKEFISYANAGTKWYCTRNFNFSPLQANPVWMLSSLNLAVIDEGFQQGIATKHKRLVILYNKVFLLVQSFLDVIRIFSVSAEQSLEQSLLPLKEELKEKHPPHLAIIFAFLKLFQYLQDDLNSFTKKHLDFFYKQVLKLKPKEAIPDKIHIVFEIQKQLDKYLLKKGLLLKDGKDNNKAEVYFATEDEIVVNKTQVAEQRTLFLNNKNTNSISYVEGVYMAPDATKADGIDKDFKDEALPSRPALGAKWSKYIDPENKFILPYANARIGFVLASPVLLLNEGKREITITLNCELNADYCSTLIPEIGKSNPCCDSIDITVDPETVQKQQITAGKNASNCLPNLLASNLYDAVNAVVSKEFYYINQLLIADAAKKGISKSLIEKLQKLLTIRRIREEKFRENETDIIDPGICYCAKEEKLYEITIPAEKFKTIFKDELIILKNIFKPRKALNVLFSGEKGWIAPLDNPSISMVLPMGATDVKHFKLIIDAKLKPEEAAVTFYNAAALKEDINTTLPVAKIELDDKIKIPFILNPVSGNNPCCLKTPEENNSGVSLYHFFRNITLMDKTKIDVKVCGVKNLLVQNDESVQDVNAPIFAFGARPKVGASFYIGSKEIFSKNWQDIYVNVEWKDRPVNFEKHYEHYAFTGFKFEDGSLKILESSFKIKAAVLEKAKWNENGSRRLFKPRVTPPPEAGPPSNTEVPAPFCSPGPVLFNQDVYDYNRGIFTLNNYKRLQDYNEPLLPLNIASQYGFLRFTLEGVGFQHDAYPFVLTRQLMAYADLVSPTVIGPVIQKAKEAQALVKIIKSRIGQLQTNITNLTTEWMVFDANLNDTTTGLKKLINDINPLLNQVSTNLAPASPTTANITTAKTAINAAMLILAQINTKIGQISSNFNTIKPIVGVRDANGIEFDLIKGLLAPALTVTLNSNPITFNNINAYGITRLINELETRVDFIVTNLVVDANLKDGLPSEPYTPVIKSLSLDYTATADNTDIDFIHLYPYAGTNKPESLTQQPTLLPTFCDEGNLFIGLKDLVPGSNVNMLFQLAEATADSETQREELKWYYLENNTWKLLRAGFEVLNDDTNGLTTSGIIKFLLPANMTNENTILPKGLHWIKAAIPCKSRSVSEIIGIHTQAIKATFTNEAVNDKLRLAKPLVAGAVSKLKEADTALKKINQLYNSFGGRVPEAEGHFYIRDSELLRHKNRAIQKFDYERLVLEVFPQLFKVKCINHSYALDANKYINDFPVAPGYVLMAVIPDLNQLKAAESFEPRVPASLLEDIKEYLQKISSPFVRLWVKNPRYEKINFCLRIKLLPGKDEVYYKDRVAQDIREFLAPWAVGKYDKLTFGEPVNQSDIIRFLESRDYLDYIIDLRMIHADDDQHDIKSVYGQAQEIIPITPRSILIAGTIDVCIEQQDCEQWCFCKDASGQQNIHFCDHTKIPVMDYCNQMQQ
jgi:hypothetical protein